MAVNLSAIDLNLLVALDALIAEAHVGRAARRIGLSQPATSHALKRLRDLLADPLLVRVGSRMELTPRALGLREALTDTLQRVHTLFVDDSFDPRRSTRRFAIMMQDHVAHLVVPALVTRVHAAAPGVTLDVLSWQSPASMTPERLRAIDLLISCTDADIPGFQREPLFTDTEVAVVRTGHPFVSRLQKLTAFLDASHVAVVGRGLTEDPVDAWLREEGVSRRIVLQVPSYLQALHAVARADVIAVVPKRLATSHAKALSLRCLRPPLDPGVYQEYVFYARRMTHDPASLWLRRRLSDRLFD
jgi:DNA-binding transcriptional LysR family regulator